MVKLLETFRQFYARGGLFSGGKKVKTNNGFSLIELLIVVSITLVLAATAAPLYTGLQVSSQLNENTSQIIQTIRTARERSVAGLNNAQHGVFFEINPGAQDRFVLYQGSSYAARDASYDRAVTLDKPLSFSVTLAGDEVAFSRGVGVPNTIGVINITHEVQGERQISVNNFGKVEEN